MQFFVFKPNQVSARQKKILQQSFRNIFDSKLQLLHI